MAPPRDIVVIGASAGGLQAVRSIVERLPADLAVTVFIVMHTRAESNGLLPEILRRVSAMPVAFARNGDQPKQGRIYVARPDHHLLVTAEGLVVAHGPRENGFRPAIDPLFRTAARVFGPRVIGIVLSGALSDGTYGLSVIKHHGGIAIVQDPADAVVSSMPLHALQTVEVDAVLPARAIAADIVRLAEDGDSEKGSAAMARRSDETLEPQLPEQGETEVAQMEQMFGPPSALTCPDCGGALWELREGNVVRYQCHVGHQYGPDSLDAEQREQIDSALWSAVRVLEEHAELKRRMARSAAERGLVTVANSFVEGAEDARRHAQQIRTVLFDGGDPSTRAAGANAKRPDRSQTTRRSRTARRRATTTGTRRKK